MSAARRASLSRNIELNARRLAYIIASRHVLVELDGPTSLSDLHASAAAAAADIDLYWRHHADSDVMIRYSMIPSRSVLAADRPKPGFIPVLARGFGWL